MSRSHAVLRQGPPVLQTLTGLILAGLCSAAAAQQFSLYLQCKGDIASSGKKKSAYFDLALRDNNQSALVQRSNILPVGERLKYDVTPIQYSMKMGFAGRSAAFYDWWRGALIVWAPHLQRLHEVRLSIDRQTGQMEGELVDGKGDSLGRVDMACEPRTNEDAPRPKF